VFVATEAVVSRAPYWFDRVILSFQGADAGEADLREFGLGRYQVPAGGDGDRRWTGIQRILTDLKQLPPERRALAVAAVESPAATTASALRPLSIDEVRRLSQSNYVAIGSHSHCHSRLCQLRLEALDRTIAMSKRLLEDWTSRPVTAFSYPNGECDGRIVSAVRRHGFSLAVRTGGRPWAPADSPWEIPRVGIGRYDGWNRFRTIVSGIRV
jgi:hypothetical protein